MKLGIFESITTSGGHEVDFDRILVDECKALGHEVKLYVPSEVNLPLNYQVPIEYLNGKGVSYTGLKGWRKTLQSIKREWYRQSWYRQLYQRAVQGEMEALIIPTSTYRYLRALNINALKRSPIPILFILHGINPKEASHFFREVEKLLPYPQIQMVVLTFGDNIFGKSYPNVHCINPPTYIPRDIKYRSEQVEVSSKRPLRLGFFGQYRREKKLDAFLDAFTEGEYQVPVELLVQGATNNPTDAEDFQRIICKYGKCSKVSFLHKGLFGADWQLAIAGVDAILMPYSAERYRYHWAGMLFTAIGYQKPVVVSNEINPEVMERYKIGKVFATGDARNLQQAIKEFINTFPGNSRIYAAELERAALDYSPRGFAERLIQLCTKRK